MGFMSLYHFRPLLFVPNSYRYVVNALHCDVCSLCMPSGVHGCLFHWFLGQCFLVEGHPYMTCFCTFWQSYNIGMVLYMLELFYIVVGITSGLCYMETTSL